MYLLKVRTQSGNEIVYEQVSKHDLDSRNNLTITFTDGSSTILENWDFNGFEIENNSISESYIEIFD